VFCVCASASNQARSFACGLTPWPLNHNIVNKKLFHDVRPATAASTATADGSTHKPSAIGTLHVVSKDCFGRRASKLRPVCLEGKEELRQDSRISRSPQDLQELEGLKESQDLQELQEPQELKELQELKESQDLQDLQESQELKESQESQESQDVKKSQES